MLLFKPSKKRILRMIQNLCYIYYSQSRSYLEILETLELINKFVNLKTKENIELFNKKEVEFYSQDIG